MATILNPGSARTTFDSRTEAILATIQPEVQRFFIRDLCFERHAEGTALTNADGSKWAPSGRITIDHFAENTTPGTTNMRAAIISAINWADKLSSEQGSFPNNSVRPVTEIDLRGKMYGINSQITVSGKRGIRFCGGGGFVALGSWTSGQAMFNFVANGSVKCSSITFENIHFEGNHVGQRAIRFNDTVNACGVIRCTAHGFKEKVVYATTKNSELRVQDNRFCQFIWSEVFVSDGVFQPGFPAALSCDLVDIETPDYYVTNNVLFLARNAIKIGEWAGAGQIIGNHPWGVTEYNLLFKAASATITGNYFDNGPVKLRANTGRGAVVFYGNFFLRNTGEVVAYSRPLQLESNVVAADGSNLIIGLNTFNYTDVARTAEIQLSAEAGASWATGEAHRYTSVGNRYTATAGSLYTSGAASGLNIYQDQRMRVFHDGTFALLADNGTSHFYVGLDSIQRQNAAGLGTDPSGGLHYNKATQQWFIGPVSGGKRILTTDDL